MLGIILKIDINENDDRNINIIFNVDIETSGKAYYIYSYKYILINIYDFLYKNICLYICKYINIII